MENKTTNKRLNPSDRLTFGLTSILLIFFLNSIYAQQNTLEQLLETGIRQIEHAHADSAESTFLKVARMAKEEKNIPIYIRTQINIGRIYSDKGENIKALRYYHEALDNAEKIQDKLLIASIFKNIGVLYVGWKKFDKALEYYDKSESVSRQINNEELIADCQNNKGIVYEQQQDYPKALLQYKNALEVYNKKNIPTKIAMALSNIAIVYKFQKKYQESLTYNFKAIELSEASGDQWNLAATYNNIGNLYGEIGQYQNAIKYCEKALGIAKAINAQEIIESIYDSMANAAAKAGDFKNAFIYHQQFSEAMNQFINTENARQLSELSIKYESEKKQQLIQRQQFEIAKRNNWLIAAGIIFSLLTLIAYITYKSYRHRQQKKLQTEIYKQQEIATQSIFTGEQNERIRIARDLHDSVGQMLSLAKMNLSALSTSDTPLQQTINLIDNTITEVRHISHNLMPEELNFGIFSALENLADQVNSSVTTKMEIHILDEIKTIKFRTQNELSIYRIVQEIVNNMIKHANASAINLSINQQNNHIIIHIKDNGKGLNNDSIENSKGIGWKNIHARVRLMNGKIKIQSEKLIGTQIEILLPENG